MFECQLPSRLAQTESLVAGVVFWRSDANLHIVMSLGGHLYVSRRFDTPTSRSVKSGYEARRIISEAQYALNSNKTYDDGRSGANPGRLTLIGAH